MSKVKEAFDIYFAVYLYYAKSFQQCSNTDKSTLKVMVRFIC